MAFKFSTGLRNGMLGSTGFKEAMDDCLIRIYAGPVPATADAVLSGATLLIELSVDGLGTGCTFAAPSGGVIAKEPTETWEGDGLADGTAAFFRVVKSTDDGSASTSALRIQGTAGGLGSDMVLSDPAFVTSVTRQLNYFQVALPTA